MVTGAVVGALAVSALMIDRLTPAPVLAATPAPVVVPVVVSSYRAITAVAVSINFDAPLLGIVRRSGIVTQLRIGLGDNIVNGDIVARVDAKPLIAMMTKTAPFRDLRQGDHGTDVRLLQSWLSDLGFLDSKPDQNYDSGTAAAVKKWQRSVGDTVTGRFDLGSVVWVGSAMFVVGAMSVVPGQSVVAGETLFSSAAMAQSVKVVEPPGGIQQSGDQVLEVGNASVPYVTGSGAVTGTDNVLAISAALGASGEGIGRVRSAVPVTTKLLPASSIVTDRSGRTCVFESVDGPAVAVTTLAGGLGGVIVADSFPLSEVLANPVETRSGLSCG